MIGGGKDWVTNQRSVLYTLTYDTVTSDFPRLGDKQVVFCTPSVTYFFKYFEYRYDMMKADTKFLYLSMGGHI